MDFDRQKPRLPFWVRIIALTPILVGIGWSANAVLSQFANSGPKLDLRTVVTERTQRGTMTHQVRGIGQLVSEDVVWVSAQTSGRVLDTPILPGVTVEAETYLLKLINPDLELSLIEADSEVQTTAAALRTERARLENVGLSAKSELVKLKGELDQAEATYVVSKILFNKQASPEHEVKTNKIKLESLKKRYAVDMSAYNGFQDSIVDQVAVFEEKVKQAKAKKDRQLRRVESLIVHASKSGVLAQLKVEVGQQVEAGDVLAKIVNPRKLKAVLRIPEVQSSFIRIGQIAQIDTHHGIVAGTVSRIEPEVNNGSVAVDVTFDSETPTAARPDLSVIGMIEVNRLNDVLFVGRPADAIPDQTIDLYRLDENAKNAIRTPVKIGAASINQIEILSGIDEGQTLILSDMVRFGGADRISLE